MPDQGIRMLLRTLYSRGGMLGLDVLRAGERAGLLEVAWAAGLKTSEGFTRLWPSVFTIVTSTGSFVLLAFAMKELPLGTAYAVWTGIGAVGAFIFGIVMMGEAVTAARIASVSLIVIGMVGLKLSSGH